MINIAKLIDGFRSFKATKFSVQSDIIRHQLDQGQKPSTMVISCCDLPISPSEIFSTNPGELFVINNIGGFVPKFNTEGINGIMSAFDYALLNLEVENIIILGNTKSISASMIMSEDFIAEKNITKAIKAWLSICAEARDAVKSQMPNASIQEQESSFSREAIVISLRNLLTYPEIDKRIKQNKLKIYGMQFDVENGDIFLFDTTKQDFHSML
jgi:carbonic anhydrase